MCGILEPQPIFDQPQPPRLTHQGIENLLHPFRPLPVPKVGQHGRVRQRTFQTDPQEQAVVNAETGRRHDLAVREPILTGQEFQLQQEDAVKGRTAETRVSGFQRRPIGLKVNGLRQPPQEMVLGHDFLPQLLFAVRYGKKFVRRYQHG